MSYLIKDTTQEERRKLVDEALIMTMFGGNEPSPEMKNLMERYINGEFELEEIDNMIDETYLKGFYI